MPHLIRDIINLFSTKHCAVCGRSLSPDERSVCGGCLVCLPYLPTDDFYNNPVCRLFWAKFPIEKAGSYVMFRTGTVSQQILHQLKYNHRPDVGREVGRMMARDLAAQGFFEGIEAIVAVPLHWIRQFKRGYNQSIELARGIAEETGIPLLRRKVKRVRNNESQTHKTAGERISNTQNLFRAKEGLPYRHILIVDDVLTTGSTISACACAILEANSSVRFSVLTLAKA